MLVDVVIPARNEQDTIGHIVSVLEGHELINNVIVCVDGDTTDRTDAIAKRHGAITLPASLGIRGKGQLVSRGIKLVQTSHVLFMDADYTGFKYVHVSIMARDPQPEMVRIGVPDFPDQDVPQRVISSWPWVSGTRLVPLKMAKRLDLHGYLMEVQINMMAFTMRYSTRFRFLPGLVSPYKMTPKRLEEMERDRIWGIEKGILTGENSQARIR